MLHILLLSLLLSLVINLAMFLVAFALKSDKLTDISYALSFIAVAVVVFTNGRRGMGHALLLAMITVWGVRIGGFLLYRVVKKGKDSRFDGVRENFRKFGTFWLGQAVTVWVLLIPALMAFHSPLQLSPLGIIGCIVWAVGLAVEALADYQKYVFSRQPSNKGKWIATGIWRYSRHPNYFGEILVWVGIYIFTLQALSVPQALNGLVSPVVITLLLCFVSGIPPLEKSADKKWGHLPAYQEYKKRTSLLVPLPPAGK